MRWACSELVSTVLVSTVGRTAGQRGGRGFAKRRTLLLGSCLGALSAVTLALQGGVLEPQPAEASSMWSRGVFPVVNFAGYTSHFGTRSGPWGAVEPHYGLDIAAPMHSPIRNWWGGVVESVIHDGTCGLGLVIRSGEYEHIYCHLSGSVSGGVYRSGPVAIQAGQRLRTGELIGHVGVSGRSTGPHLHWGMRFRNDWVDPALVLRAMARARQGAG